LKPLARFPVLVLLFAAGLLYFVDLGGSSIWDANEAFYVETPREMIELGDYVSPTFNYEPRLNKPVLSYWVVAGFYKLFGVSVGVQRLPIAIGGIVLIAVAFFLARAGSTAATAPLWAALGLAVSPRLMMFARRIFIDVYASMFMALTLLFFALSERYPDRRRLFLTLMYGSVGLGVLTKGPAFALLPGLVFGLYLVVHGELRRTLAMMIPAGVLIVLAIVLPWYVALYQRDGWTYITAFFLGENLARYTDGLGVNATRGPLFYVPVVFSDAFPVSAFLAAAALAWFADRRSVGPAPTDASFRTRTLLWLWILTIVGFFTISAAKQDLYIFPIVPAVAALGGIAIARALERSEHVTAVRRTTIVVAVVLLVLAGGLLYLFAGAGAVYAVRGTMLMAVIGIGGGIAAVLLLLRSTVANGLLALIAALIAMNWVFVLRVLPSFEAYKPVPAVARVLQPRLQQEDIVATYNVALPSLVYYLERHVEMAYDPAPIRAFIESPTTAYVVLSTEDYEGIKRITAAPTCVVSRHPTFDVKLRNMLAREPLPDLLVVTNRCR
jgi:4-amino-4-deoxy-L-arabinose transferase-like glycosyltransferase